jgi:hypothetical protein
MGDTENTIAIIAVKMYMMTVMGFIFAGGHGIPYLATFQCNAVNYILT